MELLVVIPKSGPESLRQKAYALGCERVIGCEWGSRGRARNLGFREAKAKWVYFLDQDMRLQDSSVFLDALLGLESLSPEIAIVAGPYLSGPGCTYWGRAYNAMSNLWLRNSRSRKRFLAGNFLLRRSAIKGEPFHPGLLAGGEEIEFADRHLKQAEVLVDDAVALEHLANHDLRKVFRRFFTHQKVKGSLCIEARKTQLSGGLFRSMLGDLRIWPIAFVWLVATLSARMISEFVPHSSKRQPIVR